MAAASAGSWTPAQVHALFGKPIPEQPFAWWGAAFDFSSDGNRIVFNVYDYDGHDRILRVNSDGSGLQEYSLRQRLPL